VGCCGDEALTPAANGTGDKKAKRATVNALVAACADVFAALNNEID